MKPIVLALSATLLLSGCTATMRADVTQFTNAAQSPIGKNFAVVAEPGQSGSLEFNYYAGLVGAALQEHGLKAAATNVAPELVVQIHYNSLGNHTETYADPAYGFGYRRPVPWGPRGDSVTYYGQQLEVQIFDGPAWRNNVHTMVYQGRATGDATVNEISAAVPTLVRALFLHFPGNNGGVEQIDLPIQPIAKSVS
jgi:hypothetical protein